MPLDPKVAEIAPGYEHELQSGQWSPFASDDAHRLFWTLQGPLEESVSVMQDKQSPDSDLEPYHATTPDGDGWHPISKKPMTKPPVTYIFVGVDYLERWAEDWAEMHAHCINEDDPETENMHREEDDPLLRCCGVECPPEQVKLEVRASKQPFVTIHDYLTAVHPWIMGQRENLLTAMNVEAEFAEPLPAETKLVASTYGPRDLLIYEEDHWKAVTRRHKGAVAMNIPVSGQPFVTVAE